MGLVLVFILDVHIYSSNSSLRGVNFKQLTTILFSKWTMDTTRLFNRYSNWACFFFNVLQIIIKITIKNIWTKLLVSKFEFDYPKLAVTSSFLFFMPRWSWCYIILHRGGLSRGNKNDFVNNIYLWKKLYFKIWIIVRIF